MIDKKRIRRITALLTGILTAVSCVSVTADMKKISENQTVSAATSDIPAFPGAVGGGKYATGGRGGEVYHVTNLNDSGEGSFRDAVSKSNRIVVFDVSGTIELKSNILCQSNITIAGQTAPGGSGITLKNYKMGMSGDNIICRYISSRPGPYAATSSGNDAWGGAKGSNSIIDHCSMGWTTDEQWGLYSNNEYYTVQYSVIGPADSWGGHKKGLHGFGMMMGKGNLTFDHNLIIHNVSRNFRGKVQDTATADFTNNVIYDWGYQTAYGTIGHLNYVNNTLKMGNSTTGGKHYVNVDSSTKPQNFKIYINGNRILNKDNSVYEEPTYDNWAGVSVKESIGITKNDLVSTVPFTTIVNGENVSSVAGVESAESSYNHVVSFAGNGISPNKRTAIDRQCAEETLNGTGSCSGTSEYDAATTDLDKYSIKCGVTYEYPSAVLTKEIVDTDNDGMPDEWEITRGLNPNDPSDTNGDYCGQGYTNIEYYINDLTIDSFPEGVVQLSPETGKVEIEKISAFETIEAEDFSEQEGIITEDLVSGGKNIGFIENGDYIMFKHVDFEDGAKSFMARLSGNASGIEIYLDKLDGTPVASVNFAGTSGFNDYRETEFNIPEISGTHNLYIRFTGGEGYLLNADSFIFSKNVSALNGELIKNLTVFDGDNYSDWSIVSGADNGKLLYGDRDVVYIDLPSELKGAEYIKTACDSKNSVDTLAEFTAGADITVYIAMDNRVAVLPPWMSDWTKTDMTTANNNDVVFDIYSKNVTAGEKVTLGTNGQSAYCVNYTVFVKLAKLSVKGDVNADGIFNIADIVMLKKYLLNLDTLTDPTAADLSDDNNIDIFDLCIMKHELIKHI